MIDTYGLSDIVILQKIGSQIKQARIEQDITQKELSRMAGVSMFSISSIENGSNTSILTLIQILRVLNRFDFLEPLHKEISPMSYYDKSEMKELFKLIKGHPLEVPLVKVW